MTQAGEVPRGYQTLAVGDLRFLEMAVDLALSAREHTDLPVALAADEETARVARDRFAHIFDYVREVDSRFLGDRAAKYGVVDASPFAEGIYLDADALLLGSLDDRWGPCNGASVALVGEFHDASSTKRHHGFSVDDMVRRYQLPRYLKCNSGVFYFRRETALDVMEECLACYRDQLKPHAKGGFLGDELALGIVGGRREFAIFPGRQPMYWGRELATLDPRRPHKPVMHLLGPLPSSAFDSLMEDVDRRRREAGVEPTSKPAWTWKHRRVTRAHRLEGLVRPFLPLARLLGLRTTRHW